MIRGDYVPQSFVEVDPDSYLKATIAVYELNEVEHLDVSRIGGLGITRQELEAWQKLLLSGPVGPDFK